MKTIEVIHAIPDLRRSAGGIAGQIPDLARHLETEGIRSRFVTFAIDDDFYFQDRTTLIQANSISRFQSQKLIEKGLPEASRRSLGAIFHSHGLWSPLNQGFVRLARKLRKPLMISTHGMLLPWARNNKRFRKKIGWALYQKASLESADTVHVTSEQEQKSIEHILVPRKVVLAPFGVTLPNEMPVRKMPKPHRVLLFLGRLHPVKNLEALIRAFVSSAPNDWLLLIAGPEEQGYGATLTALINDFGAAERVKLYGPAFGEEKQTLFAQADALVLPSFSENFGAVVAEALAAELPVLASMGTPWEVLIREKCGWWVEPDVEHLSMAITELTATSVDELVAMGRRGRQLVAEEYSWKNTARLMAKHYREMDHLASRSESDPNL